MLKKFYSVIAILGMACVGTFFLQSCNKDEGVPANKKVNNTYNIEKVMAMSTKAYFQSIVRGGDNDVSETIFRQTFMTAMEKELPGYAQMVADFPSQIGKNSTKSGSQDFVFGNDIPLHLRTYVDQIYDLMGNDQSAQFIVIENGEELVDVDDYSAHLWAGLAKIRTSFDQAGHSDLDRQSMNLIFSLVSVQINEIALVGNVSTKFFKKIWKAVTKVASVVVSVAVGGLIGFATGGPIGLVIGAGYGLYRGACMPDMFQDPRPQYQWWGQYFAPQKLC